VLGFLPVATHVVKSTRLRNQMGFNPVLGFLPVATLIRWGETEAESRFNPVLGFLPVATVETCDRYAFGVVSIPCWVFSPSRLADADIGDESTLFQSRAGFSPRRDPPPASSSSSSS